MVDCRKIKALMVEHDLSGKEMARRIGIADKTFYKKLNKGVFTSDEMNKIVDILEIEDPAKIFFAQSVN